MKHQFTDRNGEPISGSSFLEVVENLRNGSFMAYEQDLQTYMKGFAKREKMYSGFKVRHDNAENFVNDLIKSGYLIQK